MKVVNLFAQPGAGKSTTAAAVFAYLKNKGCNVELVSEFAKQLVYQKRQHEMANQVYMLGKQYKRMEDIRRYEKVGLIITDSPIMLGLLYSKELPYFEELKVLTRKLHDSFYNINVQIKRVKPYNPSGRNQTEAESDALAAEVANLGISFDYTLAAHKYCQIQLAKKLYQKYGESIKI